jgi:hypothetical protein
MVHCNTLWTYKKSCCNYSKFQSSNVEDGLNVYSLSEVFKVNYKYFSNFVFNLL